jgi:hypothetical protein
MARPPGRAISLFTIEIGWLICYIPKVKINVISTEVKNLY